MNSNFDEIYNIQKQMGSRLRRELEMDKKLKLLRIVQDLVPLKQALPTEQLMIEAQNHGFSEEDVRTLLEELVTDKVVFFPKEGFIQQR